MVADKHRNDGRWGLIGAQSVVIAGRSNGSTQEFFVVIDGFDHIDKKGQKSQVSFGGVARPQQVDSRIGHERPVVVLTRAVDVGKGFFVKQHFKIVSGRQFGHQIHHQSIVIHGQVGLFEHGGHFVLVGCHFVVPRFDRNSQFERFDFQLTHKGHYPRGNRAEIMVVQLLGFGRGMPQKRSSGEHQIGAAAIEGAVYQKIFLFPTQGGIDFFHIAVKKLCYGHGGFVEHVFGAKQRCFIVERFAGIGNKHGGNTERCAVDKGRRTRVPGSVAAGFERVAQPARRETGRIGFLLGQLVTRKGFEGRAVGQFFEETVVFFGGGSGERLKPMGVVRSAVFHGPLLHGLGDFVGQLA